jgi:hypothetical protein
MQIHFIVGRRDCFYYDLVTLLKFEKNLSSVRIPVSDVISISRIGLTKRSIGFQAVVSEGSSLCLR